MCKEYEMSEKRAREIFIFDMTDYPTCQFLDKHGNKTKDFTDDCIFLSSKEAISISEKAEKKYPNSNFQLELLPKNIRFFPCKNEDFWHLFNAFYEAYYRSIKNG